PHLCLVSHRAIWLVRLDSGAVVAKINGTELHPGPVGASVVTPYGESPHVLATDTGQPKELDGIWRIVDATAYRPNAVVVQRAEPGRADTGLLDIDRAAVPRLGQASRWSPYYSCLATDRAVAYGDGRVMSVWRRAED